MANLLKKYDTKRIKIKISITTKNYESNNLRISKARKFSRSTIPSEPDDKRKRPKLTNENEMFLNLKLFS